MPKAGTISVLATPMDLREAALWLGKRPRQDASWLVTKEQIEVSNSLLSELGQQLRKASLRKSSRRARRISLEKNRAHAFVLAAEGAILRRERLPRGVRNLWRRARLRLRLKPGPSLRNQPRQKVDVDPHNRTGMQKEYRRRTKIEADFAEILKDGGSFLGSAAQHSEFAKGKKLP